MLCFILGILLGLMGAVAGLSFLAYWLCSRSHSHAAERFMGGIGQALGFHHASSSEPSALDMDVEAVEEPRDLQDDAGGKGVDCRFFPTE